MLTLSDCFSGCISKEIQYKSHGHVIGNISNSPAREEETQTDGSAGWLWETRNSGQLAGVPNTQAEVGGQVKRACCRCSLGFHHRTGLQQLLLVELNPVFSVLLPSG